RSRFDGPVALADATVEVAAPHGPTLYPGEANFSWAFFSAAATFYRTRFSGVAYFWRTVFAADVTFEEAKFDGGVLFSGAEHEVCVAPEDLPDPGLFGRLRAAGLLHPDRETTPSRYAQFLGIKSPEQLARRLGELGLDRRAADEVVGVWKS